MHIYESSNGTHICVWKYSYMTVIYEHSCSYMIVIYGYFHTHIWVPLLTHICVCLFLVYDEHIWLSLIIICLQTYDHMCTYMTCTYMILVFVYDPIYEYADIWRSYMSLFTDEMRFVLCRIAQSSQWETHTIGLIGGRNYKKGPPWRVSFPSGLLKRRLRANHKNCLRQGPSSWLLGNLQNWNIGKGACPNWN